MSKLTFMRLLVFFDLPVTTREKRRDYTRFRQFLLKDGYHMLQFSVYSRLVNGRDALEKHYQRLNSNLPPEGSIRCMQVTEKQYAAMILLLGDKSPQEKRSIKSNYYYFKWIFIQKIAITYCKIIDYGEGIVQLRSEKGNYSCLMCRITDFLIVQLRSEKGNYSNDNAISLSL